MISVDFLFQLHGLHVFHQFRFLKFSISTYPWSIIRLGIKFTEDNLLAESEPNIVEIKKFS